MSAGDKTSENSAGEQGTRQMAEVPHRPTVGLFVTCLVDLMRPSVGLAAVTLLERAGCRVQVPSEQTCCGQPAYNSGDREDAQALARHHIDVFSSSDLDYVVAPSASCAGMIRHHYPRLLADDPGYAPRARALAEKTHELLSFLVDVRGMTEVPGRYAGKVTYHDTCSALREMGVREQPRRLLAAIPDLTLTEMAEREVCCGFGGTFSVTLPEISTAMVSRKCANAEATEAALLVGGDLGCLFNIAGRLHRLGSPLAVRHVAEVLAGEMAAPPISGLPPETEGDG